MNEPGTLLFRCDAGVEIGTGHVMRCLALAQAWQDQGGKALFAMAETTPAVEERLKREKMELIRIQVEVGSEGDAEESVALAGIRKACWAVIDGYRFGADYQAALKAARLRTLFIDDDGLASLNSVDAVLNQNLHARESLYGLDGSNVKLLLGPRYVLLRREFNRWRGSKREIPPGVRKVLVTMGGSDATNFTLRVIEAIRGLTNLELETTVVVGGSNPYLKELEAAVRESGNTMRLVKDVADMPQLIAESDLGIANAGTTSWELCFMGLPAIVCALAENQEPVARELESSSICHSLGRSADTTTEMIRRAVQGLADAPETRLDMSQRAQLLIDGHGASRVVAMLQSRLRLRRACSGDCQVFWELANDPVVRTASFSDKPVTWEEHVSWFQQKLKDPNAILYTVTDDSQSPIGQARFQLDRERATISISVTQAYRGRGTGLELLNLACERLFAESQAVAIDGFVKQSNAASVRLFSAAGFRHLGVETVGGQLAIHFSLEKSIKR